MSTLTTVLFASFELKTAVESLKVETVGIPFSMQGSSLESCDCTAVESFGQIAVESLGSLSEKKYGIFWEFFPYGGEGSPKSQNFCDLTK